MISEFYKNKKVLVTGHTGFKGSWLSKILNLFGAEVTGVGLSPNTSPSLFNILDLDKEINSIICDIRNLKKLKKIINEVKPEIIFHLAAQPLVRESYLNPVYTYETNVMGTVNLLECIRECKSVKSVVNITTDKVYENKEWDWGYREIDRLNGFDPYSNSKSCSELITSAYSKSFFQDKNTVAISTARAGNVIGGGDFSKDRIIPDCVKSTINNEDIIIRNPNSIRPYQHVLEALYAYLLIAERQYYDNSFAGNYNIAPSEENCVSTGTIANLFCEEWNNARWKIIEDNSGGHESNYLKLDSSKIRAKLGWKAKLTIEESIKYTISWYKSFYSSGEIKKLTEEQIYEYFK